MKNRMCETFEIVFKPSNHISNLPIFKVKQMGDRNESIVFRYVWDIKSFQLYQRSEVVVMK